MEEEWGKLFETSCKSRVSRNRSYNSKLIYGSILERLKKGVSPVSFLYKCALVFQKLNQKAESTEQALGLTTDIAKMKKNQERNRFAGILPYDQTRVTLQPCRNKSSDYINANFVTVSGTGRSFICTQAPLPHTIGHFWEMIWKHNCTSVVMLNTLAEMNVTTCAKYWPNEIGDDMVLDDSDACHEFHITLTKEAKNATFVSREFTFKRFAKEDDESQSQERKILHFHFLVWPDFSVPETPELFLDFWTAVSQASNLKLVSGKLMEAPMVVHCAAGVGRTGVFVLVDVCLSLLGFNKNPDISSQLLELRKMRMALVETPDQLRFCYQAIILKQNRLSVEPLCVFD